MLRLRIKDAAALLHACAQAARPAASTGSVYAKANAARINADATYRAHARIAAARSRRSKR